MSVGRRPSAKLRDLGAEPWAGAIAGDPAEYLVVLGDLNGTPKHLLDGISSPPVSVVHSRPPGRDAARTPATWPRCGLDTGHDETSVG
jgi:hypothetical protein